MRVRLWGSCGFDPKTGWKNTSYVIANPDNPDEPVGTYHVSALKVFKQDESATPVHPLRKRGRPRKTFTSGSSPRRSGRRRNQRGESVTMTFCFAFLPMDGAAKTFLTLRRRRDSPVKIDIQLRKNSHRAENRYRP
ncbi:hypothetical protein AVEN_88688-1 [Araneus ventricosus]|uniref:Uncharacterized protein n=1 Tax=Araneus ventricosus TaxID=182803 RepID=A0A4Y2MGJ1_ARAVE|nr:hypothetical protein AVEN_88688-1 [Araneus ventricosus]